MSDSVLYLYQVLLKYLMGFIVTDLNCRVDARVVANVDGRTYGRTNGWKTRSLYRAMPVAGATKLEGSINETSCKYSCKLVRKMVNDLIVFQILHPYYGTKRLRN